MMKLTTPVTVIRLLQLFAAVMVVASCGSTGVDEAEQSLLVAAGPQLCLPFNRIEDIKIADVDTIIYITNRQIFKNTLANSCYGIESFSNRILFSYNVTNNIRVRNLCSGEVVGVVDFETNLSGQCELGEFEPVSQEEADQLLK